MNEINRIRLAIYEQISHVQRKVALATVVYVEGSAYRCPGALMLVSDDGRWEGAISGGCLGGDALCKARKVMRDGKQMVVRYDTMAETPDEIALAILSEINAFFSQRSAGFLTDRAGPIHERVSVNLEQFVA